MLFDAAERAQDPVQLQARLVAAMALLEEQSTAVEQLRVERDRFRAERDTANTEIDKLRLMIKQLLRSRCGAHSEKLDPDQLQLALEEVEQSLGAAQAGEATKAPADRKPPQRNRGALPGHLPRFEIVVDVEDKRCPCCGGAMHVIGEDVSEMLDIVPAQYRVKVIRRPRYGCRGCEGAVVQAAAPERPLTGGIATEAVLAQILVAKYCDHLPLYRQAQIFARHGIDLDRSTLANWVGRACWWLRPLAELLLGRSCHRPRSSPTTRRCRCSIPGAAAPRPDGCGPMPGTTGPGRDRCRPRSLISTARTGRACTRRATSPISAGCCKSTAIRGSTG